MSFALTRRVASLALCAALGFGAGIDPADLRAHVALLSSDLLEGRDTPSRGLDLAAEYIAAQFRRAGLSAQPDGTYFQQVSAQDRNVIGVLRGSDIELGKQYVLVTAHYDHTGICAEGKPDAICNGANDNASGVASMIETARWMARHPPKRTLIFIAYSAEEKGLVGSRHYADNPVFPLESTVAQINFEQTGRIDDAEGLNGGTLELTGYAYSNVAQVLTDAAAPLNVKIGNRAKWSEAAFVRSDNEALAKRGIPAHTLAVSFMFPDYHRPGDEWQKLDYENMALVTRAAAAGIAAIANRDQPPQWTEGAPYGGDTATKKSQPAEDRPAAASN